ncbi:MAG: carboxymuconolactone decarboxylase family protein [Comamonas sp.]|nr:carboxymuconolactone decarboxylase family protein [Comamonas sp.]
MSTFDHAGLTGNINNALKTFRQSQSDVMKGFAQMVQASMADGAIDAKTKELIALAIGVTQKCSGCIGFHVQALHKLGATRAELDEMLGICVYMGGGPALMYCAEAIDCWEKIEAKKA